MQNMQWSLKGISHPPSPGQGKRGFTDVVTLFKMDGFSNDKVGVGVRFYLK